MDPANNGHRRDAEHITAALFRWVVFIGISAMFVGGVAMALIAIWRWIF
jgi:hypothetical protein